MPRHRAAFVTGASSGLGLALARRLLDSGAEVVLAARREERLRGLAAELGSRAHAAPLDVTDAEAVEAAVRRWDAELGGLDLVVAGAGIPSPGSSVPTVEGPPRARSADEALEPASIRAVVETNLLGATATLVAGAAVLRPRGRGTLAAITSLAGERGMPGSGAYSASKAGLSRFLETLRLDLAGTGLVVVDLRPGFVRTPLTDGNEFEMPGLLEVDDAAQRCLRALERGRPVAAFPRSLAWPLALARLIPAGLWQKIAARGHPRARSDERASGP